MASKQWTIPAVFGAATMLLSAAACAQMPDPASQYPNPQSQYPASSPQVGNTRNGASSSPAPGMNNTNNSPFGHDLSTAGSGGADVQLMKDRIFVRKAAEGGFAEVQLGQLAAQKASSDDVRKYGQKMVDDHQQLNKQMAPVADRLGVHAPSKLPREEQEEYDKLNALSGSDFDKEYLLYMLKDHRQDLHDFHDEEEQTNNADLKQVVGEGERVIVEHLRMGVKLARENGLQVGRSRTPPPSNP